MFVGNSLNAAEGGRGPNDPRGMRGLVGGSRFFFLLSPPRFFFSPALSFRRQEFQQLDDFTFG